MELTMDISVTLPYFKTEPHLPLLRVHHIFIGLIKFLVVVMRKQSIPKNHNSTKIKYFDYLFLFSFIFFYIYLWLIEQITIIWFLVA